eukprot:1690908-Pyramimonas_sp.AAC.1
MPPVTTDRVPVHWSRRRNGSGLAGASAQDRAEAAVYQGAAVVRGAQGWAGAALRPGPRGRRGGK